MDTFIFVIFLDKQFSPTKITYAYSSIRSLTKLNYKVSRISMKIISAIRKNSKNRVV